MYVLDSNALVAFIFGEPGHDRVAQLLAAARKGKETLLLAEFNYGEVLYVAGRVGGLEELKYQRRVIPEVPINLTPVDRPLVEKAAQLKSMHGGAYGDAICAALAEREKCRLLTGDKDLERFEGIVQVEWLR